MIKFIKSLFAPAVKIKTPVAEYKIEAPAANDATAAMVESIAPAKKKPATKKAPAAKKPRPPKTPKAS